jgi:2-polyprenyl-6-methoxyphenol hydroxylase-like FAD-dependent oxidoreductase
MRAVIVGGGIGGLCAALALRRAGWDVTVLERAAHFGEIGAGITLMGNALAGLDALGVGDEIRAQGRVDAPGGTRTADGRWLARIDARLLESTLGTAALGIHRATLHRILLAALPGSALVPGAAVTDITPGPAPAGAASDPPVAGAAPSPQPGSVATGAVSGSVVSAAGTFEADLIVGADGIDSLVRRRLWPRAAPASYAGTTAWRGITDDRWDGDPTVAITWGPGAEFGMVPLGDGRVYWFGAVVAPEGVRAADELAEVRRLFGGWHEPIPGLMAATSTVLHHDLRHLGSPLPTYVRGNVALLGDAAHAMTPNLGQGAAQAIEDAVVLGATCPATRPIAEGLADYDAQRRPRSQSVAAASYRVGRIGHQLTNPLLVAARNAAIRLTPPRVVLRSMARYADWRP